MPPEPVAGRPGRGWDVKTNYSMGGTQMWRWIFLFALLSILLSASGHAAQQSWEGTLEAELSFRHDPIRFLGSGIADVTYGSQLEAVPAFTGQATD